MWTSTTGGGPWVSTYRTSDGAIVHREYTYNPDAVSLTSDSYSLTVDAPSMYPPPYKMTELDWYKINGIDIRSEEEIPKMKTYEDRDAASMSRRYAVACSHPADLQQDKILKCISTMKAKLMMQCAPVRVENIECRMTPAVKQNIIMAYKKLEMYGKKTPFVARFDEYGRRLEDEIKIDTMKGMTIKIIDPEDYGPYHIEFEGIVYDTTRIYKPDWDYKYDYDVPF